MTRNAFLSLLLTGIISCTALIFPACKNGESPFDGLPRATQKGANTMGCRINGEAWKAKGDLTTAPVNADFYHGTVGVGGTEVLDNQDFNIIRIGVNDIVRGTGVFPKTANCGSSMYGSTCFSVRYNSKEYSAVSGQVTITALDTTTTPTPEVFVSGTFEFTAQNTADTTDVIEVTDGRFDISFQ
jgi:hypothetical protein